VEDHTTVFLVSRWKLGGGLDEAMLKRLRSLAQRVEDAEPDTLMYRVSLQAPYPLDNDFNAPSPPPPPIPLDKQQSVVFVECYRNAEAFSRHVHGEVFQEFLKETIDYFEPNPDMPGWPVVDNDYMDLQSGFIRRELAGD
jgi:quinol monooxygenase YgiN